MLIGPVRGVDAHQDVGRITYHSQGRAWIVDPISDATIGADTHSVISVEEGRYRTTGGAELIRSYGDSQVDGVVVNCSVHLPVQWRRHFVFARTSNYLVVFDQVRASREFNAWQQWIVAPDVEIERTVRGFFLRADGKTVSLTTVTRLSQEAVVEPVFNREGQKIASRIRIPLQGVSARVATVIADVQEEKTFDPPAIKYVESEFAVTFSESKRAERLVVTPQQATIVSPELEVEDAIAQAVNIIAAGDLSLEESLEQRINVRRLIERTKQRIREQGATLDARREGLQSLLHGAVELRVTGLRDHGLNAAIADVAGVDLFDEIELSRAAGVSRRGPLVQWGYEKFVQPRYNLPLITTLDPESAPVLSETRSIWSVDLGQLVPSSLIVNRPGDVLTVYFHGATDRNRFDMPRYERVRSMGELDSGPLMFFSDPSLDLDSRMILSWFAGNEEVDLHREIARMIDAIAKQTNVGHVVLVGNSGGGFTVLQVAAYLDGAHVVSFNPQIEIDRYVPRIASTAQWALYGRESVADDPALAARMNAILRYEQIGFDQDIDMLQNVQDDLHYTEHFLPFRAAYGASAQAHRLVTETPDLGPGHRVPPIPEYLAFVRRGIERARKGGGYRGMREF